MEGQIEGHPARLLLRLDGWMSIFYEANGQIYLYQVWNVSSAMYDVMIRLEAADVAVVRGGDPQAVEALARRCINRGDLHQIKDFDLG